MIGAVLVALFLAGGSVFALRRAVLMRRSSEYFEAAVRQSTFYPVKRDFQRGLVRGWLPFAVGIAALTVGMPLIFIGDSQSGVSAVLLIGFLFFLIFMTGIALQFAVAWFNRPRWCVPSHVRDEDGVWIERRKKKTARRRRK